MPRKRHKTEEVVAKLRQADVLVSQGQSVVDSVRAIGVTEVTYYRWRQEYGGLKSDQVHKLKELEAENARPRRAVSDLTLDKMIQAEAARANFEAPPRRACIDHVRSKLKLSERQFCGCSGSTGPLNAALLRGETTRNG